MIIYEKPSNHSLFKLKKSILLVELLRHIGVWMMLIEALDLWSLATEGTQELNGMESAAVDVEVDIPAVEIRGAGFPHLYLWMHGLYGFPDGLADTYAINPCWKASCISSLKAMVCSSESLTSWMKLFVMLVVYCV